ncbi:MAG: hypothetical protein MJ146_01235 [Clostridia bacterium]|nr:hypothetical protein [Clostridia bacterium]
MKKNREYKDLRFLVLGIVCLTIFLGPVLFFWLQHPSIKTWSFAGIIALIFAGIAYIRRFIDANRKY